MKTELTSESSCIKIGYSEQFYVLFHRYSGVCFSSVKIERFGGDPYLQKTQETFSIFFMYHEILIYVFSENRRMHVKIRAS